MSQGIPFAQLVGELRQLCQAQSTGMAFITTDDHKLAQVSLENGNIVYLFFNKQRGKDALQALRQVHGGHLRFTPGTIPSFRSELPPAEQVLDFLHPQGVGSEIPAPQPTTASALTEQEKSILQEELTEFVGPMAVIVCQEHLQTAPDLHTALDKLCLDLPDPKQAEQFKSNVLRRLKG
ncbi:MAG: DUF4388 domain-containing protein [Candidatus Competibacteraceae bacterium]|jgi:hypothetical protein|nr:DUF4388 domain-containing protein [Candidatus Competibacteraceae bacterium]